MEKFIEKVNEMFAENAFTNADRVHIDLVQNGNAILVSVCDDYQLIRTGGLTEYGILMEIMYTVDTLYCGDTVSFFANKAKEKANKEG